MLFISLILSPSILLNHIFLSNLFSKFQNRVLLMFCSFFLYFSYFLILINFFNFYYFNIEFVASISLILFFCLGYIEFFSMICRGFSLRILTDIYLYKRVDNNNILRIYADNKGIDWLFEKRLKSIENLNLILIKDEKIFLKHPYGVFVSYFTYYLKKILFIRESGE